MAKKVSPSARAKFAQARAKVKTIRAHLSAAERTANALARAVGKGPLKKKKKRRKKSAKKKTRRR